MLDSTPLITLTPITPALYTTDIANNLIGRQLFYKAVSVGNSLGNTDELAFTYTGRNPRCM